MSWIVPLKIDGDLKCYVVSYGRARDKLDATDYSTNKQYLITSLEEDTYYFVQVYTDTDSSLTPSSIKHARTLEDGEF